MSEEHKSYVGPNEVDGVLILDEKTPGGQQLVKVLFSSKDVTPEIMPRAVFEKVVSEVPKDYNWLREERYRGLLDELAKAALEYDLMHNDIGYVTTEFRRKLEAAFDRATNILWTNDDTKFDAQIPVMAYRTILEAERVMQDYTKRNNGTESGTTEG